VHHLPCKYHHNTKAWMIGYISQDYISALEWQMKAQKREILLLTDNCTVHKNVPRHTEHT